MKTKKEIEVDGARYAERELARLIRRRMITRVRKSRKRYTRKIKHKQPIE